MFNLEESLRQWRTQMRTAGVTSPEIVNELESHLREEWERRVAMGEGEQEAFEKAVDCVGQAGLLHREFAKIRPAKWGWLERLKLLVTHSFAPVPSWEMLTPAAQCALELARQEAPRLKHGFVGTEHVLLGLLSLEKGVIPGVFQKMGVNRAEVREKIANCVSGFAAANGLLLSLPFTPRVKKSLAFASREAKVAKRNSVAAEDILVGLLLEGEGVAGRVLRDFGLTAEATRQEIARQVNQSSGGTA